MNLAIRFSFLASIVIGAFAADASAERFRCCDRLTFQERANSVIRSCRESNARVRNFDRQLPNDTFKASDTRPCRGPGKRGFVSNINGRKMNMSLDPGRGRIAEVAVFSRRGQKIADGEQRPGLPNGRVTYDACRGGDGAFATARKFKPYQIIQVRLANGKIQCYAHRYNCDQRGKTGETELAQQAQKTDDDYRSPKDLGLPACGRFNTRRPVKNRVPTPTPTPTPTATATATATPTL